MNLPAIELQMLYGRLAWAIVLAAIALLLLGRRLALSRAGIVVVVTVAAGLAFLPGPWTPVHWLGLAFQYPSATSVGLCLFVLLGEGRRAGGDLLSTGPAALVVLTGALLYLDASGWISIGLYFAGFSAQGAPVAALVLAALCMAAAVSGLWRKPAMALFGALIVYMVLRLPTGNLWDSMMDPFLWIYALAVVARAMRSARSASRRAAIASDRPSAKTT